MRIIHVKVGETIWPVDVGTDDDGCAEWVLRYGTTHEREVERLGVASILSAYGYLTDPSRPLKDAIASLRQARAATQKTIDEATQ